MATTVTLDTNDGPTMNLDDDESKLLDEISIQPPTKKTVPLRPKPSRPSPFSKRAPGPREDPPTLPLEDGLDMFMNPGKRTAPPPPMPEEFDGGEDDDVEGFGPEGGQTQNGFAPGGGEQVPSEGYKTIEDEKADLLNKITRLVKKGVHSSARLTIYSDIEEIRTEYKRLTYAIDAERAIRFQKRMLIACVTGLEFLNKRFDPFDLQLDGWSENVMENQDDYDGVFEELYNKYNTKVNVAPEVKLIMMIGGSAMMFHLTNSMFKSALPDMGKVLKQNPDLVKNMMDAVQRTQTSAAPQATNSSGRREMKGPSMGSGGGGFDMSSLFSMMGPPPPMGTREPAPREEDEVSDIVSVDMGSETREVDIRAGGKKRKPSAKKKEVVL